LLAATLPSPFSVWTGTYVAVAGAYSLWLKRLPGIDVLALAALYTLRVLLGAAAIAVPASSWLLLFTVSLFLGLALLKRYAELADAARLEERPAPGRGYHPADRHLIGRLGVASGCVAVLIIATFVSSTEVAAHYSTPLLLWGLAPLLAYWLTRAWRAAFRGDMHDDPIVYALSDPASYAVVAAMAGLTYLAM
jgi:4-hydroxybenzoate polyprenyltransferase